jgi:hypothetical protein
MNPHDTTYNHWLALLLNAGPGVIQTRVTLHNKER